MNQNNLKIKEWSEEDRPREKLISKGIRSLSNFELLAIIIGNGTRGHSAIDLSHEILQKAGNSLNELSQYTVSRFVSNFKGIGKAKAVNIIAALELGRRRKAEELPDKQTICCSRDAFLFLNNLMGDLYVEEFWVLLVNKGNKIIDTVKISQGGIAETTVDKRLIFREAILQLASGIILCHNHPSGNIRPSSADDAVTKKIKEIGTLLGVQVLDHIIIGNNTYYSYADEGRL